jgi:hypothetical protein
MNIFIHAKPGSKEEGIERIDETHYIVSVKEPPIKGRANIAIIKALAEYFKTNCSRIKIVSGYTSRNKTVEITL